MSNIKKYFVSRWRSKGVLLEADLSQIEIVVQAFLSGDPRMKQDVRDGVDFHCTRLAFKLGEDYESVKAKCATDPAYAKMRKDIKGFSFQRAYGAGVAALSEELGLPPAEIKAFIKAEESLYPGVVALHQRWIEEVERNRKPTALRSVSGVPVGRGWMQSSTGKRYVFTEEDAPAFLKRRGTHTSFRPTQIKNYENQGLASEILKLILGSLYRQIKSNTYDGILLINTIHDSIVADSRVECVDRAVALFKGTIENAPQLIKDAYGIEFDLPVRADISVGESWQAMVKI